MDEDILSTEESSTELSKTWKKDKPAFLFTPSGLTLGTAT